MLTKYGRSPWLDGFPVSRVPSYPRHRGHGDADVAVIGGGLTGCVTAYALAAAGVNVVLLEAEQVGRGSSAMATGWMSDDPGASFIDVEKIMGMRRARHAWQSWRRAALDFAALLRRLDVKCDLEPRGALTIASTADEAARMKREQKIRQAAGLDASMANARAIASDVAVSAVAGLKTRDGATIDPYRATLGLAAAAAARGARVFERSPARRTTFNRKLAVVHTSGGSIRVRRVVVATGTPTTLFKSLQRHFWFKSSYLVATDRVPARLRQLLGARKLVLRDSAVPSHVIRWVDDERLLVAGADGDAVPIRLRDKAIVQRTGQLMYELSTMYPDISGLQPAYGWSSPYARTAEGLPYLGPHRNFPHHVFAFGDASHSVTGAYLASRIFLRHVLDEVDAADEAFAFTR
jgi:glycine/D-amino acid oxidase-like deaminating enzyme